MHQEVGAGCPGSLDGLPELLLSELKLTQTHTHTDKDTNRQTPTHQRACPHMHACCLYVVYAFMLGSPSPSYARKVLRCLGKCQDRGFSSCIWYQVDCLIYKSSAFVSKDTIVPALTYNLRCLLCLISAAFMFAFVSLCCLFTA